MIEQNLPKLSVVTISYNQAEFLPAAIDSVLGQNYPNLEYIIVDPGSTDGSRKIIESYGAAIAIKVFEPDKGAADGLNKGFSRATGDIYFYLNSDDRVLPGAFRLASTYLSANTETDVVCGHAWITDGSGRKIRRVWSDPVGRRSSAYGASIQIQPSTYIRGPAFRAAGGFNPLNKSNWDGELMVNLTMSGANIAIVDEFMSEYRLHEASITGSGSREELMLQWNAERFSKLMGRPWRSSDRLVAFLWKLVRQTRNPEAFFERLFHGPVYRRGL